MGHRQHALERGPVPDLLDPARPAREGVDAVQAARRQRRRQRHQRDHRTDREAARRARRLLGYATHAHWRMDDTMAKDRRARGDLMMQVWPAAVARVKEEVADMQAIADKRERSASRSSRGTTSTTPRRCARRSTTSSRARSSRTSSSETSSPGRSGRRSSATAHVSRDHRSGAGLPSRRARVGGDRHGHGRARRPVLLRPLRARRASARARGCAYRTQSTFDGRVTAIASNNTNFVKGAPASPC